jgi:hypothetical protein
MSAGGGCIILRCIKYELFSLETNYTSIFSSYWLFQLSRPLRAQREIGNHQISLLFFRVKVDLIWNRTINSDTNRSYKETEHKWVQSAVWNLSFSLFLAFFLHEIGVSSVAIATRLRAGRSGFGGSILGGAENIPLLHRVQTGSGALQVSYPIDTGGLLPWG